MIDKAELERLAERVGALPMDFTDPGAIDARDAIERDLRALASRCYQPAGEPVPLPEPCDPGPVAGRDGSGREVYAHNGCGYNADDMREYAERVAAPLRERVAELERKTLCMMGVGDGSGRLFVYGDYYAIKAAQAIVIRAETAERERDEARARTKIVGYAPFGRSEERGWVALMCYAGRMESEVISRVIVGAIREGFKGTARERLTELGWEIRPLFATIDSAMGDDMGLTRPGDWAIHIASGITRVCCERYAKGWNDCIDERRGAAPPASGQGEALALAQELHSRFSWMVNPDAKGRHNGVPHEHIVMVMKAVSMLRCIAGAEVA